MKIATSSITRSLALSLLALTASSAIAQQLSVKSFQSGNMAIYIDSRFDTTDLTVTGLIDVRDIDYIAQNLPDLVSLDISGARIEAYEGFRKLTASEHFNADELPAMSFAGTKLTTVLLPATLTAIGEGAFSHTPVTALAIPSRVTRIGAGAFAGCTGLVIASLPDGLLTTGENLFAGCSNLVSVTWNGPDIPANAFAGCSKLGSFIQASPVYSVGDGAFAGCSALKAYHPSSILESIGSEAFRASGLETIDFKSCPSLAKIGAWAFANCTSLTSVELPVSLTAIGASTFFDDTALTSVTGTDALTAVPAAAYKGASVLDVYDYAGAAASYGPFAFYGMKEATLFNLPSTLTYVGDHAFDGCSALQELNAPDLYTVPALGDDVWGSLDRSLVHLKVHKTMLNSFKSTPVWNDFMVEVSDSGSSNIEIDSLNGTSAAILASIERGALTVKCGEGLAGVEIYSPAGAMLLSVRPGGDTSVSIGLERWSNHMFIVRAITPSGRQQSFKLAR